MPDNSSVHQIRLAGPWEVITDAGSKRIKMPASWQEILGTYCGTAIFKRAFNSPTGLTSQRLFIVLPLTHGHGNVQLNGQLIGEFNETEFETQSDSLIGKKYEVTGLIQQHNQLEIELTCQPQSDHECGLCSAVMLEIVE